MLLITPEDKLMFNLYLITRAMCSDLWCWALFHCVHCGVYILIPLLLKSHILCLSFCVLPGGRVHVLWVPARPLGPAGIQPVLSKEPLTLPPPATSPGLEVPQLHFHAHWVSSHLSIFQYYYPEEMTHFKWLEFVHVSRVIRGVRVTPWDGNNKLIVKHQLEVLQTYDASGGLGLLHLKHSVSQSLLHNIFINQKYTVQFISSETHQWKQLYPFQSWRKNADKEEEIVSC